MSHVKLLFFRWRLTQRISLAQDLSTVKHAGIRVSSFCLLAIMLLLCPFAGSAQQLGATLMGAVTDTSGAMIPHVAITLTRNGINGVARVVESDDSGNYIAPNLTAGTYSITAVSTNFATYKGNNIVLNVAEKHTLNIQLKAGSISQTVVVEDNPVSVNTESSAQAGTISGTQVRELELSSRNFEQLVTLQPGVVSGLGDEAVGSNTALAVNGARTSANNWTVDGADINDSGANLSVVNLPSVDAIQEFTLQRGTYDAGYGRSGGAQIIVATKNGTSSFHGNAYEFVRNTLMDANTFFNKQAGTARAANHHNAFGFTAGGPIFIPKIYNQAKNKTFFFWSEEWNKIKAPTTASMSAASADQIKGIIAGNFTPTGPNGLATGCTTYDAASNTTTINSSCYSNNSKVYLDGIFSKYPANSNGVYLYSFSAKNNLQNQIVRFDHYFNEKVHFYARGMFDDKPIDYPMGMWAGNNYPNELSTSQTSPSKNVVGNLSWTLSARFVNELEFVFAQGAKHSSINSGQFVDSSTVKSSLTNNWAYTDPYGRVPTVSIVGITGVYAGGFPYSMRNLDRSYFDNLTILLGKHTVRTGFQFQQMLKTENALNGDPSFSFNTWGDFLLGNVYTYSQSNREIIPNLHYVNSEAYVQDDWKVNKRLTVNLGVRWSAFPTPSDVNNTLNNFDPSVYTASNAPVIDQTTGSFVAGQSLNGSPLVPATYANGLIFPVGAACTAAQNISKQVSCSSFGSRVNPNRYNNFGPRVGFAYNPDGRGITSIRGGFGLFNDRPLNGIWEQNAFNNPPLVQTTTIYNTSFDDPSGSSATSYTPNGLTVTGTPSFKIPTYANYNISVQRQLVPSTTFEVSYVGNVARHLLGEFDMNQPTLASRIANPGVNVNALRPYLGYSYIHARAPLFTNNYNSLQVSLNHRSSRGLTVGIAYTWSKDLTTNSADRAVSVSDSSNFKRDYGPSASNTPQIFEANYVYELPFYKGQNGLVGHTLGGWEISGVTSFVSGSSFTVTQTTDPFTSIGTNGIGLQKNGDIKIRPDLIANIQKTKTQAQWFSTSSFATAVGHFGSERVGSLLGPGYQNWDLATIKNMRLYKGFKFQLRGEYFNAFNHTNFNAVDTSMSDKSFGRVTSAHVPRRIQIGAKLNF